MGPKKTLQRFSLIHLKNNFFFLHALFFYVPGISPSWGIWVWLSQRRSLPIWTMHISRRMGRALWDRQKTNEMISDSNITWGKENRVKWKKMTGWNSNYFRGVYWFREGVILKQRLGWWERTTTLAKINIS